MLILFQFEQLLATLQVLLQCNLSSEFEPMNVLGACVCSLCDLAICIFKHFKRDTQHFRRDVSIWVEDVEDGGGRKEGWMDGWIEREREVGLAGL